MMSLLFLVLEVEMFLGYTFRKMHSLYLLLVFKKCQYFCFFVFSKSSLFVGVLILIFVGLNFFLNVWITAKKKRDVCKRINSLVELLQG